MNVQEENVLEDSVVDSDKLRHFDMRLWRGHKANSEFVCLLVRIMHEYQETFEHFIEHLRFSKHLISELHDCRIDDAKSKLQELQGRVEEAKIKLPDSQDSVDDDKTELQDVYCLVLNSMVRLHPVRWFTSDEVSALG
ncbi:hypothetical protein POM88_002561 [Heracleum sosnowskyi]|uniref:Uncharacterized protein n=1 Tax=Heracleum sosnowskyi TaxID=360622 RepID=A0AAD8JHW3_9APIA|nr:hypothetical protein POM88_002561 [Heracleum sosnowskyi]